jgi:hypothetical protein
MKLRFIIIFLSFFGLFSSAGVALAQNYEDEESRMATLELRKRLEDLRTKIVANKIVVSQTSSNIDKDKVGLIDTKSGDGVAREAIADLRKRMLLLESLCGVQSQSFSQIKSWTLFKIEDQELRRAILDLRSRIEEARKLAFSEISVARQKEISITWPLIKTGKNLQDCKGKDTLKWNDCFGSWSQYEGEWQNGKFNGIGTFTWPDGKKYLGEWLDDMRNGRGIRYYSDGTIIESGIYNNGKLVNPQYIDPNIFTSISSRKTSPEIPESQRKQVEQSKEQLEQERLRLAEERRQLDAEKAQREQEKKSSRIAIKGSASQPDANGDFTISIQTGADTASLKIDGEEVGGKRDGNYVIKRVARVGEQNSYSITARDVFGNTDSSTITVARQIADSRPAIPRLNPASVKVQLPRDAVAIIIGIENYRRVAKADFANADAKDFYTYASRALGIKPENIKLLVDDGADDIEILNAFQNWLPLKVNKGKTDVYVFYSGHGYPSLDGSSLYFLPFNVDKQYLERTSVKQKEVVAALQKAQAKSVTMFIDACYSGQTRGGEILIAGLKPIALKADEKAYPPEFTVITASTADQFSSASQDLKHGIFSFYLMKGMEGDADLNKDGRTTSGELQRYLSEMVGRQAMGLNRTQNTQLFGDADRVLVGR